MARIIQLDHIALNVRDVDRSLDFYHRLLGLEVLRLEAFRAGEVRFVSVRVSDETIIDLFPTPADEAEDGPSTPPTRNLNHFCLVTDEQDMEALQRGLERAGHAIINGPGRRWGARGDGLSVYVHDPDGNVVELRAYAGMATGAEKTSSARTVAEAL